MGSECAQRAGDFFDFILLKQTDGGDASGSGFQAGCSVLHGDTAESEDRDLRPASFAQSGEASGGRSDSASFSEDWSEDREIYALRCGAQSLGSRVAGRGH